MFISLLVLFSNGTFSFHFFSKKSNLKRLNGHYVKYRMCFKDFCSGTGCFSFVSKYNYHCKSEFITNLNNTLSTVREHLSFEKGFSLWVAIEHAALEIVLLSVISCPPFTTIVC